MMEIFKNFGVRDSDVLSSVQSFLDEEEVKDSKIEIIDTSDGSEGCTGLTISIKASGKKNLENVTYNLFLKHSVTNKIQRISMPFKFAYLIESDIYSKILISFQKMLKSKNLEPLDMFSGFYGSRFLDEREIVLLDDLTFKGFSMHDIRKPMDMEHIHLVLSAYARWHSMSIAYKREHAENWTNLYSDINEWRNNIYITEGMQMFNHFHQNMCDILKLCEEQDLLDKVKDYDNVDLLKKSVKEDKYAVIVHEDCWNNNYLFKYKNNSPVSVKLIDWQLSASSYLEIDLATFLMSSLSSEDLPSIPKLLDFYYDNFSESLHEMGHDANQVYEKSVFLDHWKEYAKFGTFRAPFLYSKFAADEPNPNNVDETKSNNVDEAFAKEEFNLKETFACSYTNKEVSERIVKLLRYLSDNDLL